MKIKDILKENVCDVVARFYKEGGHDFEKRYNPEVVKYHEKNSDYYEKYFKEWFNEEVVPVFTKPVDKAQPEYTNSPDSNKLQSPGYRGLQYALHAAGLPYNHNVQKYDPDPSKLLATQTMDGLQNTNGR